MCIHLYIAYSLNTTFTDCEESLFNNLAHLVKWVDTPVQYRGKMTTEDVRIKVNYFEKALEVSDVYCLKQPFLKDKFFVEKKGKVNVTEFGKPAICIQVQYKTFLGL